MGVDHRGRRSDEDGRLVRRQDSLTAQAADVVDEGVEHGDGLGRALPRAGAAGRARVGPTPLDGSYSVTRVQLKLPNVPPVTVSVVGLCADGDIVRFRYSSGNVDPCTTMRWKFGTL